MSPWIADQIARQPLLLDELIDRRRTELYAPQQPELDAELDALLAAVDPDDLEQQMERLRQFAHGNMLRVAAADLTGADPAHEGQRLSDLRSPRSRSPAPCA